MKFSKLFFTIIGLLSFINIFCQNAPVSTIGSATSCPNSIITLPLNTIHCPAIAGFSFRINYDASVLSAVQIGNNGISLSNINDSLSTIFAAQTNDQYHPGRKKIMIIWYTTYWTHLDTSISNIVKLCDIPFRYLGGTTTISFDNSNSLGSNCEWSDSLNNALIDTPTVNFYINGSVSQSLPPVIQGNIIGNLFPCVGSYSQYSVANSSGISYSWVGPGSWTGSSDSSSINFLIGTFSTDSIIVAPVNACGDTGASVSFIVNQNLPPGITGNISGNIHPSVGSYSQYSVVDSSGLSYFWTAPGTWTGSSTSSSITFLVGSFTSDTIFVRPINICGDTGNALFLVVSDTALGISYNKYSFDENFQIFPNPSNGKFAIYFNKITKNSTLEIFNSLGEKIVSIEINNNHLEFSSLPEGVYFIKFSSGNNLFVKKVIITK